MRNNGGWTTLRALHRFLVNGTYLPKLHEKKREEIILVLRCQATERVTSFRDFAPRINFSITGFRYYQPKEIWLDEGCFCDATSVLEFLSRKGKQVPPLKPLQVAYFFLPFGLQPPYFTLLQIFLRFASKCAKGIGKTQVPIWIRGETGRSFGKILRCLLSIFHPPQATEAFLEPPGGQKWSELAKSYPWV